MHYNCSLIVAQSCGLFPPSSLVIVCTISRPKNDRLPLSMPGILTIGPRPERVFLVEISFHCFSTENDASTPGCRAQSPRILHRSIVHGHPDLSPVWTRTHVSARGTAEGKSNGEGESLEVHRIVELAEEVDGAGLHLPPERGLGSKSEAACCEFPQGIGLCFPPHC